MCSLFVVKVLEGCSLFVASIGMCSLFVVKLLGRSSLFKVLEMCSLSEATMDVFSF
jgi:hypothetical protein